MTARVWCLLLSCSALAACGGDDEKHGSAAPRARALAEACAPELGPQGNLLVDDFEDNDELLDEAANLHGLWYVENDGSGQQSPLAGSARAVGSLLVAPGSPTSPRHALHTSGAGFEDWGAFVGVKLNASRYAGCTYDLSAYTGLRLAVKGQGSLRFNLGTIATTPTGDGGTCESDTCSDYGATVALDEDWRSVTVAFDELAQPDWATPAELDTTLALRLSFWAEKDSFDFWLDDVRFYP